MLETNGDELDKALMTRMFWPLRMGLCLLCLSFATALFTLSVFKILSFFIMPSLFFDLLFIGFPVGAWLGARFGSADRRLFLRCLWGLEAIMAAAVASCLLAKQFDYLRAHLFDIELSRLVVQVGTFVVMFMPFFAAYGLCEYLGYQVGRRHLGGRMRLVYALALFGAALAFLSLKTLLPQLGMARMLALAFISLALAILIQSEGWARWAAVFEVAVLLAGSCSPGLESQVYQLFAMAGGALGVAGVAVWWALRRRGDPRIPARSFSVVAGLSLLIGANFLMVEHTLVLTLFRRLYVYDDALGLGAVGFLTLSGLGSLLAGPRLRPAFLIAAALAMAVLLGTAERLSVVGLVLTFVPVALATGMFFPALFDLAAQNPLAVFAFDAVGAGLGALAATFIPIALGIDTFVTVSGGVFLLTVAVDAWFHHHLDWAFSRPRAVIGTRAV